MITFFRKHLGFTAALTLALILGVLACLPAPRARAATFVNLGSFFTNVPTLWPVGVGSSVNGGTNVYNLPLGAGNAAVITNIPTSNTYACSISGNNGVLITVDVLSTNLPIASSFFGLYFGCSGDDNLFSTASNCLALSVPCTGGTNRTIYTTNVPATALSGISSLRFLGAANSNVTTLFLSNLNFRVVQTLN